MNLWWPRVLLTVVSLGIGAALAFFLVNRWLIRLREGWKKSLLLLLTPLTLAGILGMAALRFQPATWAWVVYCLLVALILGELRRWRLRRFYTGSPPVDTVPHNSSYLRPFTTTDIVVHRYAIELPDWPGPSFRIAHLSDLHVNPVLPMNYYRRAISLAEESNPDFVFLTGDFVTEPGLAPRLVELLKPLADRQVFAVLGNHDYWRDAEAVRTALQQTGIIVLHDEYLRRVIGRNTVLIGGTDHPWSRKHCPLPPPSPGEVRLMLTHTPDNVYRLNKQAVHCVFSGHFHAGQFRIPFLGPIVIPSAYGRRFDHGHFVVNGTHLFVAGGVGVAVPPVRLFCQPDIFVVDVNRTGEAGRQGGAVEPAAAVTKAS
ncbi:MAG: metallophosphoesterase [Kiritimatiellae bacterium]|nr:metallophosphoesterase [Kiritimatiellia bacterium]